MTTIFFGEVTKKITNNFPNLFDTAIGLRIHAENGVFLRLSDSCSQTPLVARKSFPLSRFHNTMPLYLRSLHCISFQHQLFGPGS